MTSRLTTALASLSRNQNLTMSEAEAAVSEIMEGEAPDVLVSSFLTALHIKGESAEELSGAVHAVRGRMVEWDPTGLPKTLLDNCGTGGDGANTVNISTATALVIAACGVPVAKHGNRSSTSNSGSAEVLKELGIDVDAELNVVRQCLRELGITFLFAPRYHPALRFAGPVRRQLPFRTIFNLIGPLANPTLPTYQLVGVAGDRQAELVASTLLKLGIQRAAVVTGADGLDEVSLSGSTHVRWIESGSVQLKDWTPLDFGLSPVRVEDLGVSGPAESAARILRFLQGEPGPVRDLILANTAAALLVAGTVSTLENGVALASSAVDHGQPLQLLERWRTLSQAPL